MNQPVIVDFSQVEEALRHSSRERDIEAARQRSKNAARLIKYTAAGTALVILSIGVAFWFGMQWHRHQSGQSNTFSAEPAKASRNDLLAPPEPKSNSLVPENKVVASINLFRSLLGADMGFFNPYFLELSAGHLYPTSNSEAWERAWCYANFRKGDLNYRVELEQRAQLKHDPLVVSYGERRELGLTDADVTFLRARCPWR